MYPYVDSNGLHCPDDGSTKLSLVKTMAGQIPMYTIVCNNHYMKSNTICSLSDLEYFITKYVEQQRFSEHQAIQFIKNVICKQLSTYAIQLSYDETKKFWVISD